MVYTINRWGCDTLQLTIFLHFESLTGVLNGQDHCVLENGSSFIFFSIYGFVQIENEGFCLTLDLTIPDLSLCPGLLKVGKR
jgi:hypothetical protein